MKPQMHADERRWSEEVRHESKRLDTYSLHSWIRAHPCGFVPPLDWYSSARICSSIPTAKMAVIAPARWLARSWV